MRFSYIHLLSKPEVSVISKQIRNMTKIKALMESSGIKVKLDISSG